MKTGPVKLHSSEAIERFQSLGEALLREINERKGQRSTIEQRWLEDLRHYHGGNSADYDVKALPSSKDGSKSSVFVNLTRQKAKSIEARLTDGLEPTGERNWTLDPSPDPELSDSLSDFEEAEGEGGETYAGIAREELEEAQTRANAMEMVIHDQLTESDYGAICRRVRHQGVVIGTGTIKAPVVVNRDRRRWQQIGNSSVYAINYSEKIRPAVEWVDTWNFYPDLRVARIEDSERNFERRFLTRHQVIQLAKRPRYLIDNIREVLEHEPSEWATSDPLLPERLALAGIHNVPHAGHYELWEAEGPIDKALLQDVGFEVDEDVLASYWGTIVFIGNIVVKVAISPMDTGETIYSTWSWEPDDASVFGYGVPYRIRTSQKVINGAWRQMLDNAAMTAGPLVVIDKKAIEPQEGDDYTLGPWKLLLKTDPSVSVNDVVKVHEFQSHQNEFGQIIALARQFLDDEVGAPMIAQGEMGPSAPQTLGQTSIVMNAANTMLRDPVKNWDDNITTRVIRGFYDYNMEHHPNPAIKGDMECVPKGSSALMVKETQSAALAHVASLKQDPDFRPFIDPEKWLIQFFRTQYMNPSDILKDEDKLAELRNQDEVEEGDPAAEEAAAKAQAQVQIAEMKMQTEKAKIEVGAQIDAKRLEIDAAKAEQAAELKVIELQTTLQSKEADREIAMMKMAQDRDMTLEQVRANLDAVKTKAAVDIERTLAQEQNKADLAVAEIDSRAKEMALKKDPANASGTGI